MQHQMPALRFVQEANASSLLPLHRLYVTCSLLLRLWHVDALLPQQQSQPPTSLQAGMQLLREHVFIHLEHPADKLNLLLAMLNKLFALASGECCEDNPDALTHHEVCVDALLLVVV